jgi:hypothetical protein
VPLSDHEQRLLEQIERALYAEDPKFATTVRSTDLKRHYRRRIVKGGVLFVFGLCVLLGGTVTKLIPVGVGGFLLMLTGALVAVAGWKRLTGSGDVSGIVNRGSRGGRSSRPAAPRTGVVERFEERWRRRRDERDEG